MNLSSISGTNFRALPTLMAGVIALGCTAAPLPPPVTQADAVAESGAAMEAKDLAPQAFAAAEKMRAEAGWLYDEGRLEEAGIAGEQAIAGYNEAFALARAAKASERMALAQAELDQAKLAVAQLDVLQGQIAADADAYEMRARVHLDKEEVKDVDAISPERAKARRLAAKQLAAEADTLCLATRLLDADAVNLDEAEKKISVLAKELSQGSMKDDLYPRATEVRADCLQRLTLVRRPETKKDPESAESDRLLKALSETGKLFAYRDDRGVVVNLPSPLSVQGSLSESATEALKILAGTAKAHPDFPVLLVIHTAKNGQEKRAEQISAAVQAALENGGVAKLTIQDVQDSQPAVSSRLQGSAEKNERVEVIFITPSR